MRETPLHGMHVASGAKMAEFGGWRMPIQYGPILDEVRTVRSGVGLFDLSHMGRLAVAGPDASAFLDRMVTAFCARIPAGSIRYALLCQESGGCLDDLLVYREPQDRAETESYYLVVNAANTDSDLAWLRAHAGESRVEIVDHTAEQAMVALQGPASEAALRPLVQGFDLASLGYYKFGFARVAGLDDVRISRTGYTGEDGFEVYLPASEAERVWGELLDAGEPQGIAPIGLGARDVLRLEAGMALYGHEIDREHDPLQAGLGFAVSFAESKGDWIGRAALEGIRVAPSRRLVGIVTEGKRVPRQGYPLVHEGRVVGEVRSGSVSPTLETNVGSAYLPPALAQPGQRVDMDIRGKRQPCTVVELPFYSRTRKQERHASGRS